MGWAERANPQSRRNRRLTGASYTPLRPVAQKATNWLDRIVHRVVGRIFRRAA